MNLHQKIATIRTQKGMTQQELADMCNVTARTIQRIEGGDSVPRSFTLKAIAQALEIPFAELNARQPQSAPTPVNPTADDTEDAVHFLRMLCLSCFGYLIIPYVHFLIPAYLLKKSGIQNPEVIGFARKLIRRQILWVIALNAGLLLALGYNLTLPAYFNRPYIISYVTLFFALYGINFIIITATYLKVKTALFLNTELLQA